MFPLGVIILHLMHPDPSRELSVLREKFRALLTLVRYEGDIDKLQVYKRELDLISVAMRRIEEALDKRPNAKVLPFSPKKSPRSA